MAARGFIVVHIGNGPEEDYICATKYGGHVRQVFLSKKSANHFCKKLQRDYDEDDRDNPYEFTVEEVEIND